MAQNDDAALLQVLLKDPRQEQEWIRQNNLIYGGLIGAGLIMIQPFLAAGAPDLAASVCVLAFALAIPLLAALVMLSQEEAFRRHAVRSRMVSFVKGTAQGLAFVGVVAGFWHIWWIAGVGLLISGSVALLVHSSGFMTLERQVLRPPKPKPAAKPKA